MELSQHSHNYSEEESKLEADLVSCTTSRPVQPLLALAAINCVSDCPSHRRILAHTSPIDLPTKGHAYLCCQIWCNPCTQQIVQFHFREAVPLQHWADEQSQQVEVLCPRLPY